MVTRALLDIAVDRWPAELQDEMRATWLAELHVLEREGRRWEALRFAFSLAMSPPPRSAPRQRLSLAMAPPWKTAAVMLLAPFGIHLVMIVVMVFAGVFFDATEAESPVERSLLAVSSALVGVWAWRRGRTSFLSHPLAVTLAVLIPVGLTVLFVNLGLPFGGHEPDVQITRWLAGMLVVVLIAAFLARRGHLGAAWWAGAAGAVLTAAAVVVLTVLERIPPADVIWASPFGYAPGVDRDTAWAWLPVALTERSLGLVDPFQASLVIAEVGMPPLLFLMFAPYTLSYVIAATGGPSTKELPVR